MPQMGESQHERLYRRFMALKNEREGDGWDSHWRELSMYFLPRSAPALRQNNENGRGTKKHNAIYDNTGTRALRTLSAGMMAGMTSPARPWFRLETADPDLNKVQDVKLWLADVTRLMLNVFARSNTYRALQTIYAQLGLYGTASTLLLDDFERAIHHYPLSIGSYSLAVNAKGEADTVHREFKMTVGALVKEYGLENVTRSTRQSYDSGALDRWVDCVQAIEPRSDRDLSKPDAKNMAWRSTTWEKHCEGKKWLRDSGYKRFPALCPRWETEGSDAYGGSPGMDALGDVKQLQHQQLRKGEAIDFQTKPPLAVPVSMRNQEIEMFPGGVSYVDGAAGAKVESLFAVNLRLDHLLPDIADVRERINSAFYADLFLMLANSTNSNMTATEVAERHEEKLLMLGPVLERLHNELLIPKIEATFDRLAAAGVLPIPPQELQGVEINVEFVSMLAQAQRAVANNAVDRFVGNLGAVAQFKPDVLDKFDADYWAESYADQLGIDPEMIVPTKTVTMIRDQRAAQAEAANRAALAESASKSAANLGSASTQQGTALHDIINQFSGYGSPSAVEAGVA